MADLFKSGKGFLGRGFYHPHSLIAFRILTGQKDQEIDQAFFEKRFTNAMEWREELYPETHAYRWVFGESDELPGLVIDRYGDYLAVQALSAGMERLKEVIIPALETVALPKGILWRADATLRELEGLPIEASKVVFGEISAAHSRFGWKTALYAVDLIGGQKNRILFFDQRDNRQVLAGYCKNMRVLDAYCYSGRVRYWRSRLRGSPRSGILWTVSRMRPLSSLKKNAGTERNGRCTALMCVEGDALALLASSLPVTIWTSVSIDPPGVRRAREKPHRRFESLRKAKCVGDEND